jgi:MraZ protein
MAFWGTYEYQLDDRNRVPIPPRYRDAFESGAVLATGLEPCVVVHTPDSFQSAAAAIEEIPEESEEGRDARRDFYGNAFEEQKDGQGRLLLRAKLVTHAGLKKDVVVVGSGHWLEIWDKATWEGREGARNAVRRAATSAIGARKTAKLEQGG